MKIYHPYISNREGKKYMILTKDGKIIHFGAKKANGKHYEDYTMHHDDKRKLNYLRRHKNEAKFWNQSGLDTSSFWARFLLWNRPTIDESYNYIKTHFDLT
jgi:hypothetical protein